MSERVAIVGIGYTTLRPISPELSFREMIFESAVRAYHDAGITPKEVDSFVALGEDYFEGTSITDEYVPDQLGAVRKPVQTVTGDGLQGLAVAWMLLKTGAFDTVVLEGHSKASNLLHPAHIEAMSLDPIYVRPHGWHPSFIAGLEMRRFLHETKITETQVAKVTVKNKRNALRNPISAYPSIVSVEQVLTSQPISEPLTELQIAPTADGAFVFVLTRQSALGRFKSKPIFIDGICWFSDTSNFFSRKLADAVYAKQSASRAYEMAGIKNPIEEIDFAEVDDTFAYKELQHLEAVGIAPIGESGNMLEAGKFDLNGQLPVNVSGGSLGCGYLHDASSLRSLVEVVLQLRGHAGERQLPNPKRGLVCSWRGIPTATGAVAILSNV